jgi:hypothetical protein
VTCAQWARVARQLLTDLVMSPTARARMGLDVAQTVRALNITDLAAAAIEPDDLAAAEEIGESGS